jgi:hypothetical protein
MWRNPLIYTDPTGYCKAGVDAGCFVDSFSGADQYNAFSDQLDFLSHQWWGIENNILPTCETDKCTAKWEKKQKEAEKMADFYRNDPCHYSIAAGCSSTKEASFVLENGKATGVEVTLYPEPSWSFWGTASAAEIPDGKIGRSSDCRVVHYFKGTDHAPAHVHVYDNKGNMVKVGQNGKPLEGQPELNRAQAKVVNQFRPQIRATVGQIMRWYRMNRPKTPRG